MAMCTARCDALLCLYTNAQIWRWYPRLTTSSEIKERPEKDMESKTFSFIYFSKKNLYN